METALSFCLPKPGFFHFFSLELSCAWLIVENNQYQGAKFFNSSNGIVATMNNFSQGVRDYFQLREVNQNAGGGKCCLKAEA